MFGGTRGNRTLQARILQGSSGYLARAPLSNTFYVIFWYQIMDLNHAYDCPYHPSRALVGLGSPAPSSGMLFMMGLDPM